MSDKFGRNYILTVETQSGIPILIQPPFTIEFDITRNILNSANVCSIRIYNLSLFNRNDIEFNFYNQGAYRAVILQGGYGTDLATIFSGNITQAWSVREGVNFITQIECFDGGYAFNNANTNMPFFAGTPNNVIITSLASSMIKYHVYPGAISLTSYLGETSRAKAYSGPTMELLNQLTGGGAFIDNGFVNCLGNSECLTGSLSFIDSSSGLLGTPVREQSIVTFDMIFEPRLQPGQYIEIISTTAAISTKISPNQGINGFYKLSSVKHRGMISEAVCGSVITTGSFLLGTDGPTGLNIVPSLGSLL